ncbi:hypothetical protein P154DRAFT_581814 [Amniculicola lignicola CBS 123094]|uniref:C2H2-type domain-containing protein n=1 Tax=Amniculicola lignicola CBS 123094 TaxID=1392246 RepID=A0A6A5W0D8_9PLEO|nr:hypothetical protein P154DRAFT_581814 [Amniculicola lignicola CBS 123094]
MDPLTIAASAGSISMLALKVGLGLHAVASTYKDANEDINYLSSQLLTLKVAFEKIETWLKLVRSFEDTDESFLGCISNCIDGCRSTLFKIEGHVEKVKNSSGVVAVSGKLRHLWKESEITTFERRISGHIQHLHFLLTVAGLSTPLERRAYLQRPESIRILSTAHESRPSQGDTTRDARSIYSTRRRDNDAMSAITAFEFDHEIRQHPAYLRAYPSTKQPEKLGQHIPDVRKSQTSLQDNSRVEARTEEASTGQDGINLSRHKDPSVSSDSSPSDHESIPKSWSEAAWAAIGPWTPWYSRGKPQRQPVPYHVSHPYQCEECTRRFQWKWDVHQHQENPAHQCNYCSRHFEDGFELRNHRNEEHRGRSGY